MALIREFGIGFNPNIGPEAPLSDVNAFERQLGVHLSIGKKHGIFGKKLPKDELQKYHIDIFLSVSNIQIGEQLLTLDREKILIPSLRKL